MTTLYAVERYTPGYPRTIIAVFADKHDADKFSDWENLSHDYSAFQVLVVTPSSITGITCVINGKTHVIKGVKI